MTSISARGAASGVSPVAPGGPGGYAGTWAVAHLTASPPAVP